MRRTGHPLLRSCEVWGLVRCSICRIWRLGRAGRRNGLGGSMLHWRRALILVRNVLRPQGLVQGVGEVEPGLGVPVPVHHPCPAHRVQPHHALAPQPQHVPGPVLQDLRRVVERQKPRRQRAQLPQRPVLVLHSAEATTGTPRSGQRAGRVRPKGRSCYGVGQQRVWNSSRIPGKEQHPSQRTFSSCLSGQPCPATVCCGVDGTPVVCAHTCCCQKW